MGVFISSAPQQALALPGARPQTQHLFPVPHYHSSALPHSEPVELWFNFGCCKCVPDADRQWTHVRKCSEYSVMGRTGQEWKKENTEGRRRTGGRQGIHVQSLLFSGRSLGFFFWWLDVLCLATGYYLGLIFSIHKCKYDIVTLF